MSGMKRRTALLCFVVLLAVAAILLLSSLSREQEAVRFTGKGDCVFEYAGGVWGIYSGRIYSQDGLEYDGAQGAADGAQVCGDTLYVLLDSTLCVVSAGSVRLVDVSACEPIHGWCVCDGVFYSFFSGSRLTAPELNSLDLSYGSLRHLQLEYTALSDPSYPLIPQFIYNGQLYFTNRSLMRASLTDGRTETVVAAGENDPLHFFAGCWMNDGYLYLSEAGGSWGSWRALPDGSDLTRFSESQILDMCGGSAVIVDSSGQAFLVEADRTDSKELPVPYYKASVGVMLTDNYVCTFRYYDTEDTKPVFYHKNEL